MSVDSHPIPSHSSRPRGEELRNQERRLHERVVARDQVALLESFDRTAQLVFCVGLLLTGESSKAADWTERLFLEYWRAPETFAPSAGPLGLQMIRRLTGGAPTQNGEGRVSPVNGAADRAA